MHLPRRLAALACALLLAGCAGGASRAGHYQPEGFDSTTTHSRTFAATEEQTCEAARRALLSQGYLIVSSKSDQVMGRKNFQPSAEEHVEVEFRVVCASEATRGGQRNAVAFVSALQDRYGLKKVNNSASVGVGVLGSLSLPFSSSDDAMVKVASETLTDDRFYERFYALLERFLASPVDLRPPPPAAEPPVASPVPQPAPLLARPLEPTPAAAAGLTPAPAPVPAPPAPAAPAAPTAPPAIQTLRPGLRAPLLAPELPPSTPPGPPSDDPDEDEVTSA